MQKVKYIFTYLNPPKTSLHNCNKTADKSILKNARRERVKNIQFSEIDKNKNPLL